MIDRLELAPGIYGADERWLSDAQLEDVAVHVRSIQSIWSRFSKITASDHIDEKFVREISGVIIGYIVPLKLSMSGRDKVHVFQLLRAMAEAEQR
jgi:hypothetical protein